MTAPTLLDLGRAAEVAGVRYRTMRNYHQTAERHRREAENTGNPNLVRPGDLPAPDDVYGRSPVWKLSTINRWLRERPGRGAGGGRPVGWSPNKEPGPEASEAELVEYYNRTHDVSGFTGPPISSWSPRDKA